MRMSKASKGHRTIPRRKVFPAGRHPLGAGIIFANLAHFAMLD
jgi:hypothetical protein